jgi:hypothetical protein
MPYMQDDDLKQQLRLNTGALKTLWQVSLYDTTSIIYTYFRDPRIHASLLLPIIFKLPAPDFTTLRKPSTNQSLGLALGR